MPAIVRLSYPGTPSESGHLFHITWVLRFLRAGCIKVDRDNAHWRCFTGFLKQRYWDARKCSTRKSMNARMRAG
jgi:hypothetical protein